MQQPAQENLIDTLAADLRPVARLASPRARALLWLGLACALVGAEVLAVGLFGLVPHLSMTASAVISTSAIVACIVVAALAAFREAVPGAQTGRLRASLMTLILPVWLLSEAVSFFAEPEAPSNLGAQLHGGFHCTLLIVVFTLVPAVLVYRMLRRGAAVHPARCGALALLAGAACGALSMQIVCPVQEAAHMLVWHVLPTAVIGAFGYVLGSRLLRW